MSRELLSGGIYLGGHDLAVPITLLALLAAFTKSAQAPFHFWLPNAMAAPTPVSAYLHSATMVKAGIYLMARLTPLLGDTPLWNTLITIAGLLTMAVGAISEADHVNSIISAGRADLCAVARPHLANPAWTLTEAAKIGFTAIDWPHQYRSAKQQMENNFLRERAALLTPQGPA